MTKRTPGKRQRKEREIEKQHFLRRKSIRYVPSVADFAVANACRIAPNLAIPFVVAQVAANGQCRERIAQVIASVVRIGLNDAVGWH